MRTKVLSIVFKIILSIIVGYLVFSGIASLGPHWLCKEFFGYSGYSIGFPLQYGCVEDFLSGPWAPLLDLAFWIVVVYGIIELFTRLSHSLSFSNSSSGEQAHTDASYGGKSVMKKALSMVGKLLLSIIVGSLLFLATANIRAISPPCNTDESCKNITHVPGGFPLPIWGTYGSKIVPPACDPSGMCSDMVTYYIGISSSTTNIIIDLIFWMIISYIAIELYGLAKRKIKHHAP